ncbi:MAG: NADH-quinone oxidoreductase subunit L [Gemmataceae bacterium]|nr:NADH-quinone oxidoreductase subunit L [Gemmataceae bacterium]
MDFVEHPGRLYVVATLLPLASFFLLLLLGAIRNAARPYRESGLGRTIYQLCGGDRPNTIGAYVATTAIALSCVLCLVGLVWFLQTHPVSDSHGHAHAAGHHDDHGHADDHGNKAGDKPAEKEHDHSAIVEHVDDAWAERITFARVGSLRPEVDKRIGLELQLGYRIDHLAAVMFAMVTFIATLIHLFSAGYMREELDTPVVDHQVHLPSGEHLHRRGRYSRFFMYLSLFCFSMLNLVLADNLFQVFVSWELVGVCSFLLIGFYYERQSASNAANKAFITNRVGDAGFIIGMLILWTYVGTLNFQDLTQRVRAPQSDAHNEHYALHGQLVRLQPEGEPSADGRQLYRWTPDGSGSHVALFPMSSHWHGIGNQEEQNQEIRVRGGRIDRYGVIPYFMLTIAGLGIFLGCVGKSAQFPLHVWLPDAMEGPTPVSALIHAATMVAAGVYLVGRAFPLFTPEARMVIAYTGGITLFVAATIAIVMNDIKKVLAYSTVSQLGYMMLALGIGGWVAGLLHLLTHAFFKALLFLGSGSVIFGCHHEQDMRKMGGLLTKMPVTAVTMLVGVLAIAGTPLFSGWYSKDAIIAQGLGFAAVYPQHLLLLALPLITAGITCFYMFRMWFLTFTGEPKDHHVYEHAHESPRIMTIPLIVLAIFSVIVAWGWPVWSAHDSFLGKVLHAAQPAAVTADLSVVESLVHDHDGWVHPAAGFLAFFAAAIGVIFAFLVYHFRTLDAADTKEQFAPLYRLFERKWYFDELYSALLVRPALVVANWCRLVDAKGIDGVVDGTGRAAVAVAKGHGIFDQGAIDRVANAVAAASQAVGAGLRRIQTGRLRHYVVFLVLAAVGTFLVLTYFLSLARADQ